MGIGERILGGDAPLPGSHAAERPVGRRQEHALDTRRSLLEAGTRWFLERGYEATSLDDIAGEARVSKGAVYHHFGSKLGLFTAIVEGLEQENATALGAAAETTGTPQERVFAVAAAFLDLCGREPFRTVVMLEGPRTLGWQEWRALDERYTVRHLREAVMLLMEGGQVPHQPLDLLVPVLYAMLHECADVVAQSGNDPVTRERAMELIVNLSRGLLTAGPAS